MKSNADATNLAKKYIIWAFFIFSLCRFLLFINGIIIEDLQYDFTGFYIAGMDLNHGLDPYSNHLAENQNLWDGFSPLQVSRYLYPPLTISIFQLLALFPYSAAKEIWSASILIFTILSIGLQAETVGYKFKRQTWLLISGCILLFLPLIAEFERGQTDALCFFLLSLGLYFLVHSKPNQPLAGFFFALVALFKLHFCLILFYLLIKRQFKAVGGFIGGGIVLVLFSIMIQGWNLQKEYVTVQMPRISKYGCYGTESMRLDPLIIAMNTRNVSVGHVKMQGTQYAFQALDLNAFAGIPYYLKIFLYSKLTFGTWALITALFIFCLILWSNWRINRISTKTETFFSKYLFWQISLIAVLLSGPLTWIMNSLWFVSYIPLCFYYFSIVKGKHDAIGLTLLVLGLCISGFPDETAGLQSLALSYLFYLLKPILGEILCFTGLLRLYAVVRTRDDIVPEAKPAADRSPVKSHLFSDWYRWIALSTPSRKET